MKHKIIKSKNKIALFSGLLILLAFINHRILKIENISEILLIIASIISLIPIAIQAIGALRVKVISIDLLVTIAIIGALLIENYEESAVVSFLFLFGAYLEQRTLMKTRSEIKKLTEMAPETAFKILDDGSAQEIDIDDVEVDDILLVKTGQKVPVDGFVTFGDGHVNEASITGESFAVKKELNSKVFAGTILDNGTLKIQAEKVGEDTTFGKIIELVEEAQDSKSEAERFIDRFAKWYTPAVLILSLLVVIISRNIEFAITILVLGCPGALVIGVPVSNVAGIGNGAKNGILLKGSEVIHDFSKVDTIIFDKTGTLTQGNPSVTSRVSYTDNEEEAIKLLISIERESHHPLANAIVKEFSNYSYYDVEKTEVVKGGGVYSKVNGKDVAVGNLYLMNKKGIAVTDEQIQSISELERTGNSIVIMSSDNKLDLIIAIKDRIRDGAKEILEKLRKNGVKNLIMLSGDNQATVDLVSKELSLSEAYGNMLPEDKAEFVKNRISNGNIVAFVGDGVNDSPSISLSQVGIAMGSGTDVAIESSDVVLMNSNINKLPHALAIAKATALNMKENIVIAVGVVLLLLFSLIFSDWVSMSVGMLVHEASILVVILNGMRLIAFQSK